MCTEQVPAWLSASGEGLVTIPDFRAGICVHPGDLGRILEYTYSFGLIWIIFKAMAEYSLNPLLKGSFSLVLILINQLETKEYFFSFDSFYFLLVRMI